MLKSLHIQNYALIEDLTIEFESGLNIITGETGTGKSIILGALSLILGERTRADMIRQGSERAVIEAEVEAPDHVSLEWLTEYTDLHSHALLIRRDIHANGRSRAYVNDAPVPISVLSRLGDLLIDLHGQHQHQALFMIENHLNYLDNFGTPKALLIQIRDTFIEMNDLQSELNNLFDKQSLLVEKQDVFAFQLQDIETVDPKPDEDVSLHAEEKKMKHAEKLFAVIHELKESLYEGEGSAIEAIGHAEQRLTEFASIDPLFTEWAQACARSRIEIQETLKALEEFVGGIDFDANRLEQIRERLATLIRLSKKYGGSLERVLALRNKLRDSIGDSGAIQKQITDFEELLKDSVCQLTRQCIALTKMRRENGGKLSAQIMEILKELALPHAKMQISIRQKSKEDSPVKIQDKPVQVTARGMDFVEFLISLNPGETPKPLVQIASGGEISRIMLAIKTVLAEADNIPVLVFDEIDTGISGRVAHVVGVNLKKVAQKHQVICITHLPQIAALGGAHFSVFKDVVSGRSQTGVRRLSYDERIFEIAKLIGGDKVTQSALDSAKELLFQ